MSGAGGAGRGGRGAALLERLKKIELAQARRPGEEATKPTQPAVIPTAAGDVHLGSSTSVVEAVTVAPTPTPASSTASLKASGSDLAGHGSIMRPAGRGMALLKHLSKTKAQTPSVSTESAVQSVSSGGSSSPEGLKPSVAPQISRVKSPLKQIVEFRGTEGEPIPLVVNHIPVQVREGRGVFEYAVMFSPDVDCRNFRFKLISGQSEVLGTTRSFDGAKLFLPFKLRDPLTILVGNHPVENTPIKITIKFIYQRKLGECVQLFNILLRRCMYYMDLVQIGRQTYDPRGTVAIPKHKLEMWPGYITAIQEYESGLMLCAETSHRVLRTQTVLEIMYEAQRGRPDQFRDVVAKALIGCIILTRYNNKTYKVDDILWDQNPKSTFSTASGDISYVEYYKNSYNIALHDLGQPLLLHRVKKKALGEEGHTKLLCMIPELCYLTGLTDDMRSDFHVMKDLATHTRLTPTARQFELMKLIDNVNSCQKAKEVLENWGVYIEPKLSELPGRVFREEKIIFRRGQTSAGPEADWGRDTTRNQVTKAVNFNTWLVLFTRRDESNTRNFVDMVTKVGPQLGIEVQRPTVYMVQDDRNESFVRALRDHLSPRGDYQIVVVISPSPRDDRYNLIKLICCHENPVPSQVINGRTISKPQMLRSVTQKVVLQMNCKLGGELWSLEIPLSNLMVCGIDAYHDPKHKKPSVIGFVGSLNRLLTRWYSASEFQVQGQELGASLQMCFLKCLQKYHEINHNLPDKIIIYRDGVSDGQLEHVTEYEIAQLQQAFKAHAGYDPTFVFIVVQKRINTRLFFQMGGRDRSLGNPPPGTVLDNTITRKYLCDFFLVSQHVRQGTVTPTHYIVVLNTSVLKPDHIQRITYKMTHLYYNWPGTIRVPAPCQYAHKLAYLVGQSIGKKPSTVLCDRLFFL